MSRTVADATRFTATSPHAYSKPSSILRSIAASNTTSPSSFSASSSPFQASRKPPPPSSNPPPQQPSGQPPLNETPQQKVARLRALRAAEKNKPLGLWDRTVVRGRRWADIAHRTTAVGLMGVSVIAFIITAFSLTDMIMYNRTQRALFYSTQQSIYTDTLRRAIAAEQENRPLTEEEKAVINREKMVLKAEAEKEQLKELGWGKRVKGFLFGGEDAQEVNRILMARGEERREDVLDVEVTEPVKKVGDVVGAEKVMQAFVDKRRETEKPVEETHAVKQVEEVQMVGGQLDRMAEEAVEKTKGGWMTWFGGSR